MAASRGCCLPGHGEGTLGPLPWSPVLSRTWPHALEEEQMNGAGVGIQEGLGQSVMYEWGN